VPFGERVLSKFNYVVPLFLIPVVATFGLAVAPNEPVFFGRDWGIIGAFAMAFIAFVLWLPYKKNQEPWSGMQLSFFTLLVTSWLFQSVSTHLDGRTYNISAFLVPAAIFLFVIKRPNSKMLRQAFIWSLYGLVIISALALVLGSSGLIPNGFEGPDSGWSRLPILGDLFNISTRWAGPFGSVNYAAPIGALLLVAGFTLKGINRVVIVAGGLGVLTLSQGRTSAFAALFALAVLFAYSERVQKLKYKMPIRLGAGLFMFSSLIVYIAVLDPTLNGRTPIWSNFLRLFVEDPLFGIGTSGLEGYIAAGLPSSEVILYSHGHNVLIDMAVRYGIFLVILTIAALTIAAIISWRARRRDSGETLALLVFLIMAGLAESIYSWQYLSVYTVVMVYLVTVPDRISVQKNLG